MPKKAKATKAPKKAHATKAKADKSQADKSQADKTIGEGLDPNEVRTFYASKSDRPCNITPGKKGKMKIDCSGIKAIVDSSGKKYTNLSLRTDGFTNSWWNLPMEKKLKELKKAGKNVPSDPRKLYELSQPDVQCANATAELKKKTDGTNPECYICDIIMKNIKTSGSASAISHDTNLEGFVRTGRQCEHVIPVLIMTIICGLYSSGINKITDEFFKKYKSLKGYKDNYIEWRRIAWERGYLWSHTECNMVKMKIHLLC